MLLAILLAAHITNVADAADEKHPLEVDLEAEYSFIHTSAKITREGAGEVMDWSRDLQVANMRLAVGIWHDLELHVVAPLAISDKQSWSPLAGATSLTQNTTSVSGCAGTLCGPVQPILPGDGSGQSKRAGFFEPTIGIAWGPINEEREATTAGFATWALGVDYTAPLGSKVNTPGIQSSGSENLHEHVVTVWSAWSKRFRVLEPYFKVSASLPFAAKGAYDNCSNLAVLADVAAANCADIKWAGQTGFQPSFSGTGTLGAELVAYEGVDTRFSFDVRGDMTWHGPQRGYTQVSDALGKLTYADEYVTSQGSIGIYGRAARWFHMRVYGVVGVDTAHFLTHEEIGQDVDGKPGINISEGTGAAAPDQNPNYDFRLDQVGRRLRAEPAVFFGVAGTLSLNF